MKRNKVDQNTSCQIFHNYFQATCSSNSQHTMLMHWSCLHLCYRLCHRVNVRTLKNATLLSGAGNDVSQCFDDVTKLFNKFFLWNNVQGVNEVKWSKWSWFTPDLALKFEQLGLLTWLQLSCHVMSNQAMIFSCFIFDHLHFDFFSKFLCMLCVRTNVSNSRDQIRPDT